MSCLISSLSLSLLKVTQYNGFDTKNEKNAQKINFYINCNSDGRVEDLEDRAQVQDKPEVENFSEWKEKMNLKMVFQVRWIFV